MAWWENYFKDVDSFDMERLKPWFDEHVELRFGNWPPLKGKAAVVATFADFWTNIKGLSHGIYGVVEQGSLVCVEADVTFVRLDGRQVVARAATVMNKPADKITLVHGYIDVTPIFAP